MNKKRGDIFHSPLFTLLKGVSMKHETIHFNENDLVLGVRSIYEYVVLRYGGNTWQKWDRTGYSIAEDICRGMMVCDTIRFITTDIIPEPIIFQEKIVAKNGQFIDWEMQTILLNQELFEKTKWYNVDKCSHNSIYEVENLIEVRIQDVLKDI